LLRNGDAGAGSLRDENTTFRMVGAAETAAQKNGALNLGGRPPTSLDIVLDGLFYRLRNAGPWRDLPECFGPWRTIYGWYRCWARRGVWRLVLATLVRKCRNKIRLIDGTHVAVHQCAANPAGGADKQAMGRTRGGRNTKIMAATDGRGLAVSLLLVEGQAYEGHHVLPLLPQPAGLCVVGDKGFDSDKLRQQLHALGATHCIPRRARCGIQRKVSRRLYRQRYRIENYFCRLKRWACASTRRDKLALHFLSLIQFASIIDWLRHAL
jgi:transposase